MAAGLNYLCDQYGWLPSEQCQDILETPFSLLLGTIIVFLNDEQTPTLEDVDYAYWGSFNLLILLAEDYSTNILNEIIELGKIYSDENYDPRLKRDKKVIAQQNVDDYFKKRNPGINLNVGSGNPSPALTKIAVAIAILYIVSKEYEPMNRYIQTAFSNIKNLVENQG